MSTETIWTIRDGGGAEDIHLDFSFTQLLSSEPDQSAVNINLYTQAGWITPKSLKGSKQAAESVGTEERSS